jgi:HAE1 family hydrophobic/amphiphilic exporter-1
LRGELPAGFQVEYASDDSRCIREAVKDVTSNIMIGVLLTAFLLLLFLRDYRGTLIAAVVMPSAIISTFLLMQFSGFTLNLLSLMALGVSVGILVTNSIVVLENILRHLQMGKEPQTAALEGTREVALAVLASVMTNVVVFLPIAFMKGIVGRFFLQFGLTVVFATFFSLFISFTLTPMLSSVFLKRRGTAGATAGDPEASPDSGPGKATRGHFMERLMRNLSGSYRGILAWSLRRKRHRLVLAAGALIFLLFSFFLLRISGGEFMTELDEGYIMASVELPVGTPLEMTEHAIREVEEIIRGVPEVESVISTVGGGMRGVNEASLRAKLVDISDRDRSVGQLVNDVRPLLAGIPAADVTVSTSSDEEGSADVQIEIMGNEIQKILEIAADVQRILEDTPGLVGIKNTYQEGAQELIFAPNREEITRRGLTTRTIAGLLRNSFEGDDRSVFREGGEEYRIRVQFDDETRQDVSTLTEIRLPVEEQLVPLAQLGQIDRKTGVAEVLHRDRQKRVTITANIAEGTLTDIVRSTSPQIDALDTPPDSTSSSPACMSGSRSHSHLFFRR